MYWFILIFIKYCFELESKMEENLREAACNGDIEALESILTNGIDVNSKNKMNGWTALHWAARR